MQNRIVQFFFLLIAAFTAILFISLQTNSFNVFPISTSESKVFYDTYHEYVDSIFSEASVIENEESLIFSYSLSKDKTIQEPFAALFFHKKDSLHSFFNLTKFNTISLNIQSIRGARIPITFTLDYEGITTKEKLLSNLPLTYLIDYEKGGVYEIPLDQFKIPSWWLRSHNLKKEDLTNIDFSRVNYIVVGSCQLLERGIEDKIIVNQIQLSNNNTIKFIIYIVLISLSACALVIYRFTKKRKIMIPYVKVDLEDKFTGKSSKLEAVINYVSENYADPELSLNEIEKAVGISSREIGAIFKNELGSSFKKHLNLVRLTEIKRLLIESDQTISVIAYNTGYNNVSHFNRLFKSAINMSPKAYREQEKNNSGQS